MYPNDTCQFLLPDGYVDAKGEIHRKGEMCPASAGDELRPLRDPRVWQDPSYLDTLILAHVVVKLGELQQVDERVIGKLSQAISLDN